MNGFCQSAATGYRPAAALQIANQARWGRINGEVLVGKEEQRAMMDPTESIYEAALKAIRGGNPAAMATVVGAPVPGPRGPGAKMLIYDDGRTLGSVGGGEVEAWVIDHAREMLSEGRSGLLERPWDDDNVQDVCGGHTCFFVEVILPHPTLLILGGGHIGQAVASIGAWLGYRVVVVDERESLLSAERFPDADALISGPPEEMLHQIPLTERTYAVLVTPHHSPDERALSVLAEQPVAYVGLLGSSSRTRATFGRARDVGVPDAFLKHIHTPIGLDIHAETPREIALSILADITAVRRVER